MQRSLTSPPPPPPRWPPSNANLPDMRCRSTLPACLASQQCRSPTHTPPPPPFTSTSQCQSPRYKMQIHFACLFDKVGNANNPRSLPSGHLANLPDLRCRASLPAWLMRGRPPTPLPPPFPGTSKCQPARCEMQSEPASLPVWQEHRRNRWSHVRLKCRGLGGRLEPKYK